MIDTALGNIIILPSDFIRIREEILKDQSALIFHASNQGNIHIKTLGENLNFLNRSFPIFKCIVRKNFYPNGEFGR